MQIQVKILSGPGCTIDVRDDDTIELVKRKVEQKLEVAPHLQRLVYRGRPLHDEKTVKASGLVNNSRLHLVVKKDSENSTGGASHSAAATPNLWEEVNKLLLKHFTQDDAKLVLLKFKEDFQMTIENLSLDDIERIAYANLQQKS